MSGGKKEKLLYYIFQSFQWTPHSQETPITTAAITPPPTPHREHKIAFVSDKFYLKCFAWNVISVDAVLRLLQNFMKDTGNNTGFISLSVFYHISDFIVQSEQFTCNDPMQWIITALESITLRISHSRMISSSSSSFITRDYYKHLHREKRWVRPSVCWALRTRSLRL